MKWSKARTVVAVAALAALMSACGGNVNLGGKGSQPTGTAGAPQNPDETPSTTSERVFERSDFYLTELIVAGEHLYFVNVGATGGIFRCRKSDCETTLELFISGNASYPQAFGDRLAFTRWEYASYALASVALSNGKDEQVVIRGLPQLNAVPPLFYQDFVFFSLASDRNLYRCSLPACAGDPERLAGTTGRSAITPRADGDRLIWFEGSFIYRAAGYGSEPAIALLPDDSLSEAPAAVLNAEEKPGDGVTALDASDGVLYAGVARSPDGRDCDSFCAHDVVAWPILGGPVRHFFRSEGRLGNLRIFDGELTWMEPSRKTGSSIDASTIWSCRIEACEATRRELGESLFYVDVVGDEHDLYWIDAEPLPPVSDSQGPGGFRLKQIRRASRLPVP